jgi:DNA-binding IscR family transcriptional regulator
MIRINRQTDYAIRVVLSLAKREPNLRVSTTEAQQEMLIPPSLASVLSQTWRGVVLFRPFPVAMEG